MALAPYRYTSKRIARRWRSKNVITSMGLGFTGVLEFFQIIFSLSHILIYLSVDYGFLLLTVDIFFKKTKINN